MDASRAETIGVVLAGGQSRRMGRDKALLPWGDGTLLSHMQQRLRASGLGRVVVSGEYPHCEAIPDRFAACGPLGGLGSIAAALPDADLLVVPVDMPLVSPALLRYLRETPAADCACFQDQPLPLRLRLNAASRSALAALLEGPSYGRSLRALHAALSGEVLALPVHWQAQLCDLVSPAAWRAMSSPA